MQIEEKEFQKQIQPVNEQPRMFYKADTLLRYNPLWALVLGERSVGKSFEFKRRSVVTPNSIWVYLRRTDVLRKDPKNWKSYVSDLLQKNVIDPDAEYKINSEGLWVNGIQKVIFSALSTDSSAHSMNYLPDSMQENIRVEGEKKKKIVDTDDKKEQKQAYKEGQTQLFIEESDEIDNILTNQERETKVSPMDIKKKIIFEEIIEPKNKYLKNEVEQLFEFYVTVDRYTNTQLFGIANLMSSYNPYFDYFHIVPFKEEFRWFKNKTLLVQNVKLQAMEDFVKKQRFYNLVEGTNYAEYLTNNTPWQDEDYAIEQRPGDSKAVYNFRMHNEIFGIWKKNDIFYVSKKYNPQNITFSGLKSIQEGDYAIKKGEYVHKLITYGIDNGIIRFDSIPIREVCYELINGGYREG